MPGPYFIVVADPPWKKTPTGVVNTKIADPDNPAYKKTVYSAKGWWAEGKSLSTQQICSIEVPTTDDAYLFLWCTASTIDEALEVTKAWGFTYKTTMVWVKTVTPPIFGYYVRIGHELMIVSIKGKPKRPSSKAMFPSVLFYPRMTGGSAGAKPDLFYEMMDENMLPGKRIDMFGRKSRKGWDIFNNEASVKRSVKLKVHPLP
jgi:N6-adenosine-specific RNA methylase IME4